MDCQVLVHGQHKTLAQAEPVAHKHKCKCVTCGTRERITMRSIVAQFGEPRHR